MKSNLTRADFTNKQLKTFTTCAPHSEPVAQLDNIMDREIEQKMYAIYVYRFCKRNAALFKEKNKILTKK